MLGNKAFRGGSLNIGSCCGTIPNSQMGECRSSGAVSHPAETGQHTYVALKRMSNLPSSGRSRSQAVVETN